MTRFPALHLLRRAVALVAVALALPAAALFAETTTLTFDGSQTIGFNSTPGMDFKGANTAEGIVLEFKGAAETKPNWMQMTIPTPWTLPEEGYLEIDVRASEGMGRYFEVGIVTGDGYKYSTRLGTSQTGFRLTKEITKAVVLIDYLKAGGDRRPKPGAPIQSISIVMTTVPEGTPKTVTISAIRLVSE